MQFFLQNSSRPRKKKSRHRCWGFQTATGSALTTARRRNNGKDGREGSIDRSERESDEGTNGRTCSKPNDASGKEVFNGSIDAIQNTTHGGIRSDIISNCDRNEGVQLHPQWRRNHHSLWVINQQYFYRQYWYWSTNEMRPSAIVLPRRKSYVCWRNRQHVRSYSVDPMRSPCEDIALTRWKRELFFEAGMWRNRLSKALIFRSYWSMVLELYKQCYYYGYRRTNRNLAGTPFSLIRRSPVYWNSSLVTYDKLSVIFVQARFHMGLDVQYCILTWD